MKITMKYGTRAFKMASLLAALLTTTSMAIEINKDASIADTSTTIMGINHIGLSVKDLDASLAFYQQSTQFKVIRREKVSNSAEADRLFGRADISYEIAVLKAPNMVFELMSFEHNQQLANSVMPAKGPGMTHTCFQSPADHSGWDKFIAAGATPLSRGGEPIDLLGQGVTYGYAYDPEGNMIELEQLEPKILKRAGYTNMNQNAGAKMWMSQVAVATHDIERLMEFYQQVLGFQPYRSADISDRVTFDQIVDIDNLHLKAAWFKMNQGSKVIELWQFINPLTPQFLGQRTATDFGYSFSLEVGDINQEYRRLKALGVDFFSAPEMVSGSWQAYARDIDGNIFSLRQMVNADSVLSVKVLDQPIPSS